MTGAVVPITVSAYGLLPGRRLIVRGSRASDKKASSPGHAGRRACGDHQPSARSRSSHRLPTCWSATASWCTATSRRLRMARRCRRSSAPAMPAQRFQRFELKQLPLTYRAAANETGARERAHRARRRHRLGRAPDAVRRRARPSAPIRSTSTSKAAISSCSATACAARACRAASTTSAPPIARAWASTAMSRAEKLTQLMTRPLGLKSVSNPLPPQGGTDPEPAECGAADMPLTTRTLGRAVSLLDYEDFARAFSGIAKAQAQVLQLPRGPTIAITIAGAGRRERPPTSPVWINLLAALQHERRSACRRASAGLSAEHVPSRAEGQARSRLTRRRPCSPRSRRRCARTSPSMPGAWPAGAAIGGDRRRPGGARRRRRRPRPASMAAPRRPRRRGLAAGAAAGLAHARRRAAWRAGRTADARSGPLDRLEEMP